MVGDPTKELRWRVKRTAKRNASCDTKLNVCPEKFGCLCVWPQGACGSRVPGELEILMPADLWTMTDRIEVCCRRGAVCFCFGPTGDTTLVPTYDGSTSIVPKMGPVSRYLPRLTSRSRKSGIRLRERCGGAEIHTHKS